MSQPEERKKILVVDDEPYIQRSLKLVLEIEGYDVTTASNSIDALKKVSEKIPDLILLDIMMPGMDGWTFCERLRENAEYKNIYVLALTARGQEKDKTRSSEVGINEHISKPFQPAKLIERIKLIFSK